MRFMFKRENAIRVVLEMAAMLGGARSRRGAAAMR
jgi:hypothetical protein